MKKIVAYLLILNSVFCYGQSFDARSDRVSLNVRDWKKDKNPPLIVVYDLETLPGYPYYTRDSILTLAGRVEDKESGVVSLEVNGVKPERTAEGKFMARVPLHRGRNEVKVFAMDRNKNDSIQIYRIVQGPDVDIAPPEIHMINPPERRGFYQIPVHDTLHLRAMVRDDSKVKELIVNGEKVTPDSAGEFGLDFVEIPDSVRIMAIDTCGHWSRRAYATVLSDSLLADLPDPGEFHALIFAVEKYRDNEFPNLYHPVKDATELKNTLITNYTFEEKNVHLIQNPLKKDIINALERMRREVTGKDNLLIFYAGHGVWEEEMQQGYWLPADANAPPDKSLWFSAGDIRDYVRGIKSKRTLLIVDACFGGAIFPKRSTPMPMPASLREEMQYTVRKGMSSGALRSVPDRSEFFMYLLRRLKQNSEPYLTGGELYQYIRNAVATNSVSGLKPIYDTIAQTDADQFGDFVFVHR